MPDRLAELVRQRALVQEHLAWLDREIAQATPAPVAPAPAAPPVPVPLPAPAVSEAGPAHVAESRPAMAEAAADEIIERYRPSPGSVRTEVRKGCLLYFVAAFVLLGLGTALLYFAIGSR